MNFLKYSAGRFLKEMDIKFELTGSGELAKAMEQASKQFPASVEKILKKESERISKDLGTRVNTEAKGHHSKIRRSKKEPVKLGKSFQQGKVIHSGSNYTVAVTTKAPHYHLYEEGHDMVTHNRKNHWGKGIPGTGRKVGVVKGKKTVGKYMSQRSEDSEEIGLELLNAILKDAGFDS